jgi:hypothetical protein
MNNLLPNCGLVDARISASEKDLPLHKIYKNLPLPKLIECCSPRKVWMCSKIFDHNYEPVLVYIGKKL